MTWPMAHQVAFFNSRITSQSQASWSIYLRIVDKACRSVTKAMETPLHFIICLPDLLLLLVTFGIFSVPTSWCLVPKTPFK